VVKTGLDFSIRQFQLRRHFFIQGELKFHPLESRQAQAAYSDQHARETIKSHRGNGRLGASRRYQRDLQACGMQIRYGKTQ